MSCDHIKATKREILWRERQKDEFKTRPRDPGTQTMGDKTNTQVDSAPAAPVETTWIRQSTGQGKFMTWNTSHKISDCFKPQCLGALCPVDIDPWQRQRQPTISWLAEAEEAGACPQAASLPN